MGGDWLREGLSVAEVEQGLTQAFEYDFQSIARDDLPVLRGGEGPRGALTPCVWRPLARTFRGREAALHGRGQETSRVLQRLSPNAAGCKNGSQAFCVA
jgi:hypothetical protein